MSIQTFSQYLAESPLSRIWQHFTEPAPAGIISAFQSGTPLAKNQQRTAQLASEIRGQGYGYVFVDGTYDGIEETSIAVFGNEQDNGNLKGALRKWREQYGQESVLFKPEDSDHVFLMYQGREQDAGVFHPNRAGDFMTKLRGRAGTFVFEGAYHQMTFFEALAHKLRTRRAGDGS